MEARFRGDIQFTATEYGVVLLDLRHGRYWQLSRTAAAIVQALRDGGGREGAVRQVTARFDVDAERAGRDVDVLVEHLRSAGLMEQDHVRSA